MKKSWLIVCLVNFLIAALMGLLLRFAYIYPVHINYQYLVHAHSHTAILGWAYMMIFCLFVKYFFPQEKILKYNMLFWITQLTVIGMMISFPLQGYAVFSITFSTLHIFCSYYFFYRAGKDVKKDKSPSSFMLRASLLFMLLSTIGAWSLGAVGATGGKGTPPYYSSLQFFLHFQFNGWLIFAVLALFLKYLEKKGIQINKRWFSFFYLALIVSTVLTLALPLSWFYSHPWLNIANAIGVVIQLIALGVLIKMFLPFKGLISTLLFNKGVLLILPLFSLVLKIALQAVTVFPQFAAASHAVRNFTIGFIHLAMLGIITGFLFFFIISVNNKTARIGTTLFYIGFIITELLLFIQGLNTFLLNGQLPAYLSLLFAASLFLPAGLILITAGVVKTNR